MNIQTVADNLRRVIAGKENMLNTLKSGVLAKTFSNTGLIAYKIEFLQININELRSILDDVEKCGEKSMIDSWVTNPDRSGGQITQDEIDNAGRWI